MILFGFEIRRRPPVRVLVKAAPLSEDKINEALAALGEAHPYHQAILQLIETARDNAMSNAAIEPTEAMAGYVGGAEHLRMLREDILNRGEAGRKAKG